MRRFRGVTILFALLAFASVARSETEDCQTEHFSVMSYNVENLFNAVRDVDPPQMDETFLPNFGKNFKVCEDMDQPYQHWCFTYDWVEWKYQKKLRNIAEVLLAFNGGHGADIIAFEELENRHVLQELFDKYLRAVGFQTLVLFESPDHRGMDVGLVSKFPLAGEPHAWMVDLFGNGKGSTRDVLEVPLMVGRAGVTVLVNHWPSQRKKESTGSRMKAAEVVKKITESMLSKGGAVIALGDFNTNDKDNPNPITDYLADTKLMSPFPLVDLQPFFAYTEFEGTYYYSTNRKWNRFDRILVSKNMMNGSYPLQIVSNGFEIFAPPFILETVKEKTIPLRFDFNEATGYSDHLPVAAHFIGCR